MPYPDPAPLADDRSFAVLDAYLQELHAGRRPDRAQLLAQHPELASALDCLEALEELAPPAQPVPRFLADSERTIDERAAAAGFAPQEAGADFGKYELLGEIGRGGMGVIFKARQKDLDRVVAIKMILASALAGAHQVERFLAEARAMARLQHPNIVCVHEIGEAHGQPFLVMEYITGRSLAEAMRQDPIAPEQAARIVAQIARAVDHLHAQGIIHRDLKPSNILLEAQGSPAGGLGTPKITDFGLVKMLGSSSNVTSSGAIVGTPAYMAPEQATGRPDQVGPRSDVYSLGAILYELLTGRPPFEEENALDTLVQVIEGEPTRPRLLKPSLARPLEMICLKCLEKNPAERYPSAAALADDLERFLKGEEVEARGPGPLPLLRRWARREPALVYRLAALALLMLIVQVNYHLARNVTWTLHVEVQSLLAAWMLASVVCQQGLKRESNAERARLAWVGADVVLLSSLIALTDSRISPLLVGFPFLIAASGLWFQVRLVWFTTAACLAAYVLLLFAPPVIALHFPHFHVIFLAALAVLGFVVAYQVQRIRVLNRYYENRPLP